MPLWLAFSQYIVASSSTTPSSLSSKRVTTTAVPCGTSRSRHQSSFSRIISAQSCFSGWSVKTSSGKRCGPSSAKPSSSSMRASRPSPVLALMGTMAAKSCAAA